MTSWDSLPMELRFMIFDYLAASGPGHLSTCAAVCKKWQEIIEPRMFRQLKPRSTRIEGLGTMITDRTRPLVQYIWLHVELPQYTCLICNRRESQSAWIRNNRLIRGALLKLFAVLSTWDSTAGGLTLELSVNSPSDTQHYFKNYCFGDGRHEARNWGGSDHGWNNGTRTRSPRSAAIGRLFEPIDLIPRQRMPRVDAVTRLVIRRHLRRRLPGSSLRTLLDKLPRLECLLFEPWREWVPSLQSLLDREYKRTLEVGLPRTLKRLSIFEDFDEIHMTPIRRTIWPRPPFSLTRLGFRGLAETIGDRSLHLTHLSISFLIDACHFFRPEQRHWIWQHLEFLSLTSEILKPRKDKIVLWTLLYVAALVAANMPRLQEMVLWNGGKGHACMFRYNRRNASLTIRSTWKCQLLPIVEELWGEILLSRTGCQLHVDVRSLSSGLILCHGDAVYELGLPSGVVDAVSLTQMRLEERMV